MFDYDNILFIPQDIRCEKCLVKYLPFDLLERLAIPGSTVKCTNCDFLFTLDYVGKYFGVIKNVGESK